MRIAGNYDGAPELVNPNGVPRVQAGGGASPGLAAEPYAIESRLGQNMAGAGDALTNLTAKVQDDYNQVRIDDALNQARREAFRLQYDQTDGYLNKQGEAALPKDGTTLTSTYNDRIQEKIATIAASLGNDRQREVFGMRANDLATAFSAGVQQHELNSFRAYSRSTYEAQIDLAVQDAERNWNNPAMVEANLQTVASGLTKLATLSGADKLQVAAKMQVAASLIHSKVIDAALDSGDYVAAEAHFQAYKGAMTTNDVLKAHGHIQTVVDARLSQFVAATTAQEFAPRWQASDQNRAVTIAESFGMSAEGAVRKRESGNRDYAPDGKPMTSSKGALFAMQVMPDTAAQPGFGIRPAAGQTPDEYNRVGKEYLSALFRYYGDPAKAFAAYNWGQGNVDNAVKRAGTSESWLKYAPAETQAYVRSTMNALQDPTEGVPTPPTETEFVAAGMAKLQATRPDASPSLVKATRDQLKQAFDLEMKSQKERGDQAYSNITRELISNGGDINAVSQKGRDALYRFAPEKWDNAIEFGKKLAKDGDVKTDERLWFRLTTHTDELTKLTDDGFISLRERLSEKDFRTLGEARAKLLQKAGDTGNLNETSINSALNNRLRAAGIDPTPPDKDKDAGTRVAAISKFVYDDIGRQQQTLGRKMDDQEVRDRVDYLFRQNVEFQKKVFLGFSYGGDPQKMLTMTKSDIPSEELDQLRAKLATGIPGRLAPNPNPTDDELLRLYWTIKRQTPRSPSRSSSGLIRYPSPDGL